MELVSWFVRLFVGWLVSNGTKLTLISMSLSLPTPDPCIAHLYFCMEPRTSQWSGQVRAKTNHRVVGMDPMAKQTHLVSSLIRDIPTGLSHEYSAATGISTNQTIHTSSDSAALQSGWMGCNITGRRFLKELSNVSEVIAINVEVVWA